MIRATLLLTALLTGCGPEPSQDTTAGGASGWAGSDCGGWTQKPCPSWWTVTLDQDGILHGCKPLTPKELEQME